MCYAMLNVSINEMRTCLHLESQINHFKRRFLFLQFMYKHIREDDYVS